MKILTEETGVAISLVITLAVLAFWLGSVSTKTEAHGATINQILLTQNEFQKDVINRLSRLEALIERRSQTHR